MTSPGNIGIGVSIDASDLGSELTAAVVSAMRGVLPNVTRGVGDISRLLGQVDTSGVDRIATATQDAVRTANTALTRIDASALTAIARGADDAGDHLRSLDRWQLNALIGEANRAGNSIGEAVRAGASQAERSLGSLDAAGLERVIAGAEDARRALRETGDEAGDLGGRGGSSIGEFAGKLAGLSVVAGGVSAAVGGITESIDRIALAGTLKAQLDLTAEDSAAAGKIAGDLYAQNYGESFESVNDATGAVLSSLGNLSDDGAPAIEALTKQALTLSDVFGVDVTESAQAANNLIRNGLAKDGTEAFDLLGTAMQRVPAAMRGELIPILDEYAVSLNSMGFSGQEAIGLVVNAAQNGAIGIDKAGDAIKEFGIRATDLGDKGAQEALESIGLNGQIMANDLLAGGDVAKDAFTTIVEGLQGIKDPAQQAAAATALFGTPLEDLSKDQIPGFLNGLTGADSAMAGFTGKVDEMGNSIAEGPAAKFETFKRGLQQTFLDVMGSQVIPKIEEFLPKILDMVPAFLGLITPVLDLATAMAGPLSSIFEKLSPLIGDATSVLAENETAVAATIGGYLGFKAVDGVIGSVSDAVGGAKEKFDTFKDGIDSVKDGYNSIKDGATSAIDGFKSGAAAIKDFNVVEKSRQAITKVGTGVQAAFNLVMNANPILLIVTAIAAVVGALALFFTKTELGREIFAKLKDVVASAWESIKGAISSAYETVRPIFEGIGAFVTDTLLPAFSSLWDNVKEVFAGIAEVIGNIYETVIKVVFEAIKTYVEVVVTVFTFLKDTIGAVFTGIGDVISGIWNNVIMPVFDLWRGFIEGILIPIILFLWNEAVVPAFAAIGDAISFAWNSVIKPVFDFLVSGVQAIGAGAMWLWNEAIVPAFNAIGEAIGFAWNSVILPIFDALKAGVQAIGDAALWLWNEAIIPAWNAIGEAISFAWNSIILPVVDAFKSGIQAIGDAAMWLWNEAIIPAWDAIGNAISTVIDNVVKPAFEGMKSALGAVGDFFGQVVDGIRNVWDGLRNILAKPINFMIDTVYNNGIAKAWNKVAEFIPGLATAPQLSTIPEYREGGRIGGQAGTDKVLAWNTAGEHMFDLEDVRRAGGHSVLYAVRDMIMRGIPFEWSNGQVRGIDNGNLAKYGAAVQNAGLGNVNPEGLFDPLIRGYKDGGEILPWMEQLAKGHAFAQAQHGKSYQWAGPTGPGSSFDCSGFMGSIAAAIMGLNPWQRYFATSSFAGYPATGPMGFRRGSDAGFTIGVTDDPGGPGGGHTAGVLGAALNYAAARVESGGALGDVHYGTGTDPTSFQSIYSLPIGANGFFDPGPGAIAGAGPSVADQKGFVEQKISDLFEAAMRGAHDTISSVVGDPPPHWKDIPHKFLDEAPRLLIDGAKNIVGNIGDGIAAVWTGAKNIGGNVLDALNPFDSGGIARGTGFMPKNVIAPERVLDPSQTKLFETLVSALSSIAGSTSAASNLATTGDYTTETRNALGVEEDSPVVDAVLQVRDGVAAVESATSTGLIDLGKALGIAVPDGTIRPNDKLGLMESVTSAFDGAGQIASDTKSLLERTETSTAQTAKVQHDQVMAVLSSVADKLTSQVLVPTLQAGLEAALKSATTDTVFQGFGQKVGQVAGNLVATAVRAAVPPPTASVPVAGVFDEGGLLPSGHAGVNLSGSAERVLDPGQTVAFDRGLLGGWNLQPMQQAFAQTLPGQEPIGSDGFAADGFEERLLSGIAKMVGITISVRNTLNNVAKDVRDFKGATAAFMATTGELISDTAGLLDRTETNKATAQYEQERVMKEIMKGVLKYLVTTILIPVISAVLSSLISLATTAIGAAIGTAIGGPLGTAVGGVVGAGVGALLSGMATVGVAGLGSLLTAGIDSAFDQGGIANGLGVMPKRTIAPERVLSPRQTSAFERLVGTLEGGDHSQRTTTVHAPINVVGNGASADRISDHLLTLLN